MGFVVLEQSNAMGRADLRNLEDLDDVIDSE
jgi:hypothetical protein